MELSRQPGRIGSRRTPETYRTRRDTLLRRLEDVGIDAEAAEQWCRAWEALADAIGRDPRSARFWAGSTRWILEHREGHRVQRDAAPAIPTKRRQRPSG